uniref:Ovule protein n=1 Tax=Steinernema glaseri TaxID=37863 RepID=A0A1I7YPR1_9BILA
MFVKINIPNAYITTSVTYYFEKEQNQNRTRDRTLWHGKERSEMGVSKPTFRRLTSFLEHVYNLPSSAPIHANPVL